MSRLLVIVLVLGAMFLPARAIAGPCCGVTAVNLQTGVVSAQEASTGRAFQFKVTNVALLRNLRAGSPVYANFTTRQVSLDGHSVCGQILSIAGAAAPGPQQGALAAVPQTEVVPSTVGSSAAPSPQTPASRTLTAPAATATAVAASATSALTTSALTAPALTTAGSQLAGGSSSSASPALDKGLAADRGTGATQISTGASGLGASLAANGVHLTNPAMGGLPVVSAGPPQSIRVSEKAGFGQGTGFGGGAHRQYIGNGTLVHLRGIDDIMQNTTVPQEVRDILVMHASALPPSQIDHYIVNVQLAQAWVATHPEPAAAKGASSPGDSGSGCHALSTECFGKAVQHAETEAERQAGMLYQQAQADWQHMVGQAAQQWNVAQSCLADNTLALPNVPVQVSLDPSIPLSFSQSGKSSIGAGSVSGSVSGTATFGLPISTNFNAEVDMFYIPCLPFVIRPKSMIADGTLTVGQTFAATVAANGQFQQSFTIPPSGGVLVPLEVIPIVIATVPVAEMDVSLYLEGTLDVDGQGTMNGAVKVQSQQDTSFNFNCSGSGCSLTPHTASLPATASESAQINGRIHVKPGVYVALQLDFDVDALSARAGPRPYLMGEIYGCYAAAGQQNSSGLSTVQQGTALTADLDWGVDIIASASVAGQNIGNPYTWSLPLPAPKNHIAFWDLAHGSTALVPSVSGSAQPSPGAPAAYAVKMPGCYPYTDELEYQLSWTGGATPTSATAASGSVSPALAQLGGAEQHLNLGGGQVAGTTAVASGLAVADKSLGASTIAGQPAPPPAVPGCSLQASGAVCWANPLTNTALSLVWPQMGSYGLTVSAVRDKHGRVYSPPGTAQLGVTVQQSTASATTQ